MIPDDITKKIEAESLKWFDTPNPIYRELFNKGGEFGYYLAQDQLKELFTKDPINFLLANAMKLGHESMVILLESLYERTDNRYKKEIKEKDKEVAELNNWINDLQSGMYVNCVYCGHRYGHEKDTPVSMADVLKEHIEKCPKHPMSILKSELAEKEKEIADLLSKYEQLCRLYEKAQLEIAELKDKLKKYINK